MATLLATAWGDEHAERYLKVKSSSGFLLLNTTDTGSRIQVLINPRQQ